MATALTNLSDNRCEKCTDGIKHRDAQGMRKWCKRCIDIHKRKESLTTYQVEIDIREAVEPLYLKADVNDFGVEIREKLDNLTKGQDLFVTGPVGTGKTHLMAAIAKEFIYEGFRCTRINFDDFCVKVRSTMSPASRLTEWDLIEPMKNVDKLFIDDLGLRSKQETDFAYVTLYSILNKRQEKRLPTYISSNKTIDTLAQAFDQRIGSRLKTAMVIEMTGGDRRN